MSDLGRAVAQPFPRLTLPSRSTRVPRVDAEHRRVALAIGVRVRLDNLEPLLPALPAMERGAAGRILRELRALVAEPGR